MSDKIPFLLGGFLQLPQPISNYFHLNLSITIKLMESKEPQNKKEKTLVEAVDILAQIFVALLDNK